MLILRAGIVGGLFLSIFLPRLGFLSSPGLLSFPCLLLCLLAILCSLYRLKPVIRDCVLGSVQVLEDFLDGAVLRDWSGLGDSLL